MSEVVASLCSGIVARERPQLSTKKEAAIRPAPCLPQQREERAVWLALPDGHQEEPTLDFLAKAGIQVKGAYLASGNRRPSINLPGVCVKVIRPQDMPLQVANGNFDLAITGEDWLRDHRYRFPSSPVREVLNLGFGKVKIVAVVSQDLAVSNVSELREFAKARRLLPLRVASEYVNIADKYARDHHLAPYKVIPTWGASEAFLPEDADLLIENTETGETLARHNLKIIDTLFESSACLIANVNALTSPDKEERIASIIETLRNEVGRRG
jgi:ATP phosphoribosyltransferase